MEEERYAFNKDMAVRRGAAGLRGSHRGLRQQQHIIVNVVGRRGADIVVYIGGEYRHRHERELRDRHYGRLGRNGVRAGIHQVQGHDHRRV